jgi:membrane-associated phospholipid phosphatase
VSPVPPSSGGGDPPQRAGLSAVASNAAAALGNNMVCNLARWSRVLLRPPRAPIPPVSKAAIAAAALALAVSVAAMILIDATAVEWARGMTGAVHDVFEQITNAGLSGWWLVPSGAAFLCLAALASPALPLLTRGVLAALAARLAFVFWAVALPGLFTAIVKRLIGRARPYMDVHGDPFTYMPFAWRSEYGSLPSGHSTTVAAAALAIGALWPRIRPLMWLYALTIMFSRVVVLAHHPSDVIAGAVVGAAGAELVRRSFAARRLVFSPHNLAVYPGPSLGRVAAALHRAVFSLAQRGNPAN